MKIFGSSEISLENRSYVIENKAKNYGVNKNRYILVSYTIDYDLVTFIVENFGYPAKYIIDELESNQNNY